MNTDELIESLAGNLSPVRPLRRPALRTVAWLAAAVIYLGLLAVSMTSRADLEANGTALQFVGPQLAAIVTGIVAASAALASVVPGHSPRVFLWPALAATSWLGVLAIGARGEWSQPAGALSAPHEWLCVAVIVIGGAPLMAVLTAMLRRGAPLEPARTAALAALAVGALANVTACLSHPHTDNGVTLVWHGAAILALMALAAATGPFVLMWNTRSTVRIR